MTEEKILRPGCIICANTTPERKAKFRCLTCSDECKKTLRRLRETKGALETEILHCLVCRGFIPPATAKKRAATCGAICRNELRRYRWQILKTQKCPHCYHPSSPAEWEEYRLWRAQKGPMQSFMKPAGRGNLAWKREKELRNVLAGAVVTLRELQYAILVRHDAKKMEDILEPRGIESFDRPEAFDEFMSDSKMAQHAEHWITAAEPYLAPIRKVEPEAA